MSKAERQSNFELLKIIAMLMIVSHHVVSKNAYNVDTEIVGVTFLKLFLQFFGNQAFIGNNLFFLSSAWFLVDKADKESNKAIFNKIWDLERILLFYSIGSYAIFSMCGGRLSEN